MRCSSAAREAKSFNDIFSARGFVKQFLKYAIKSLAGEGALKTLIYTKNMSRSMIRSGSIAFMSPLNQVADPSTEICKVRVFSKLKGIHLFECELYQDRDFLITEVFVNNYCVHFFDSIWQHFKKNDIMNPIIVDAGANVGIFSKLFSKRFSAFRPTFRAFEPLQANLILLRKNAKSIHGEVTIEPIALGAAPEKNRKFFIFSTTGATINPEEAKIAMEKRARFRNSPVEEVDITTLDLYSQSKMAGKKVALLKMDVEGAEEEILRGATQVIRDHRPVIICSYEHDTNKPEEIEKFVGELAPYSATYHRETKTILFLPT